MSSDSSVTRLFLFVCRSGVERERERAREKENVSKCATKTIHITSRERGEPFFFLFKMKESVRPNGRRRRAKSRTSKLVEETNQTQRRQNASGSGYVRLMRESSKTKKRFGDREHFERFSKTNNSHPFSEHVNGHRLFLSW